MGQTTARPDWLPYVTGLRGLAALFVVLHHVQWVTFNQVDGMHIGPMPFLWFGSAAVALFLVVSGYCLMLPMVTRPQIGPTKGWADFFLRRVRRIIPAYYLTIVICLWLIPRFRELYELVPAPYWRAVGYHVLLIHNWISHQSATIDGPMWSIAAEWQIYWLMPAIVMAWRRLPLPWIVGSGTVLANLPSFLQHEPAVGFHLIGSFLLGCAAADVVHGERECYRKLPWQAITASLWTGVILETTLNYGTAWGHFWQLDLATSAAAASLLVYLGLNRDQPSLLRRMLSSRIPYELGLISYSLYLIHSPLVIIAHARTTLLPWGPNDDVWHFLFLLSLVLLLVLPMAWMIYLLAEKPFVARHVPEWNEIAPAAAPPDISPAATSPAIG